MNQKRARKQDPAHLRAIRSCPCVVCLSPFTEAAHVRMSTPDKPNPGIGSKPSDCYTVPLCNKHHREQHSQSERAFWQALNINPILLAADLYRASPHVWAMERIVQNASHRAPLERRR